MIRIDEIYNNTFWPWVSDKLPLTRLFFADPFGSTDPADLKNFGVDTVEHSYIFMHDQEPTDLVLYHELFDTVFDKNLDLQDHHGADKSVVIVSETQSDKLDQLCDHYQWKPFYYFFHGWASLDWYRGYDKTFLIQPFDQREIKYSFLSPNRIIGGRRDHRSLLIYHLLKRNIRSAKISCPKYCPQEEQPIETILEKYVSRYPDAATVIASAGLPWNFDNENDHPMTSCWLDLFDLSANSLCYVVTETVYFGRRLHLTEKTFKPICLGMPFVLASTHGSLKYLREYGFKTFGDFWDESYDDETDDFLRLEKIADLLSNLDSMTPQASQDLYQSMIPVIKHNYDHFYGGDFESLLWKEFTGMLSDLEKYFYTK